MRRINVQNWKISWRFVRYSYFQNLTTNISQDLEHILASCFLLRKACTLGPIKPLIASSALISFFSSFSMHYSNNSYISEIESCFKVDSNWLN